MKEKVKKIWQVLNDDWIRISFNCWKNIYPIYVKSFIIIFIGINIAFAFHSFSFINGDHDWGSLRGPMSINSTVQFGRFSSYYLPFLLTGNHILPVLTNLYAFVGLALGAIALCIYWKVPKSAFSYSIIGLLLCIQPYTLSWLWYSIETIPHLWMPLFVIIAYILSEKAAREEVSRTISIVYIIIAALLFVLVLGTYPSIINTMAVVLIGRLIIDIFLKKEISFILLKNIFTRHKYSFLSAIIGGIIFKLILEWLAVIGRLSTNTYHIQTIALKEFPEHFIKVTDIIFRYVWENLLPFLPTPLIRLFAYVFILALVMVILNVFFEDGNKKKKIIKIGIILLGTALLITLSNTAMLISPELSDTRQPNVLFFGDAFLHVFPIALLFIQRFQIAKNIVIIASIILLNMCLIQDALALKAWKFGFEAEKALWNRLVMRIEEAPLFNKNIKYKLIPIGNSYSYRPHYYYRANEKRMITVSHILYRSYGGVLLPKALSFFSPDLSLEGFFRYNFSAYLRRNDKTAWEYALKYKNDIYKMDVYPSKNSIIVKDDVIIIVFDESSLDEAKKLIAEREKKK
ncbi:MAG: glucosyltransferase domain-containing protein [Elusimicrobiota bacterium]|jgi:hypothetical protein|nr:glucosyltransferase domain-containing protein [Elusimicrobiota bacterium]